MTSRYLVAVDGSRPAAAALRWSVDRLKAGDSLVLVHVLDDEAGAIGVDDDAARQGARLLAETAERLSTEHPGVSVSTRLLIGSVPRALASLADPADMLVIGTGKTGFLHGRVLGSRCSLSFARRWWWLPSSTWSTRSSRT